MLQELAARTAASPWAIGSMLFFIAVWMGIAVWVYRTPPEAFEGRARLALEGDEDNGAGQPSGGTDA